MATIRICCFPNCETQVDAWHVACVHHLGRKIVETEWLTANEAAQCLKIKPRTLLQWAREKKIPSHRLSGVERCVWRFLRQELDAMLGLSSADPAEGRQ